MKWRLWRRSAPAKIAPPGKPLKTSWWKIAIPIVVPIVAALIIASVQIVGQLLSASSILGSVATSVNTLNEEMVALRSEVSEVRERVARIEGKLDPYQPAGVYWREERELGFDGW